MCLSSFPREPGGNGSVCFPVFKIGDCVGASMRPLWGHSFPREDCLAWGLCGADHPTFLGALWQSQPGQRA